MMANDDDDAAAVKGALENLLLDHTCKDVDDTGGTISHALICALLKEPPADVVNEPSSSGQHKPISNETTLPSTKTALCHHLRGLPKMPLYREISHRLQIIQRYCRGYKDDDGHVQHDAAFPCFLPASHFGLTEMCTLNDFIPPPPPQSPMDIDGCIRWFQQAGNEGICALLGCRRTIGTIQLQSSPSSSSSSCSLLPPTISQLLHASRQKHKPHTKSSLTVTARALAKHAHRGEEQFFGTLKGGDEQKNEHADQVIQRLIADAMWMNIHCFGGIDESNPVMEIRTYDGYGARWSGIWNSETLLPMNVEFRGFLEPQVCAIMYLLISTTVLICLFYPSFSLPYSNSSVVHFIT